MKKRFTEAQIIGFLRETEAGLPVKDLCRRHGFSEAAVRARRHYRWRSTFGGMSVSDAKRLKELETENGGASVIKCCYAATGMYVTAAAALLRGLANTRTTLSHQTTRRRDTKMSRSVSRRVLPPSTVATPPLSRSNQTA